MNKIELKEGDEDVLKMELSLGQVSQTLFF